MSHFRVPPELRCVRDWIRWAATEFARADLYYGHGTDEAWDDAVALIGGWLRIPPDRLETMLAAAVLGAEGEALVECVQRRIEARVPVPYLVGRAWLAGLEFEVDERTLIPRSPIAYLLEGALTPWLGDEPVSHVLDLCTGGGSLGIIAALVFPTAEVVLADVSPGALEVAARNVQRHGLGDRIRMQESDGLQQVCPPGGGFDLILCNPPYVNAADLAAMPPEFDHEPALALAGGEDGLDLVDAWLTQMPEYLSADGVLVLELGNSAPALAERRPGLEVIWPELEQGGVGVGLIAAAALRAAQAS